MLFELVQLLLRMLKTKLLLKTTFFNFSRYSSYIGAPLMYRCCRQKQNGLCEIYSGFCVPQIIKICSFLTQLFEKY